MPNKLYFCLKSLSWDGELQRCSPYKKRVTARRKIICCLDCFSSYFLHYIIKTIPSSSDAPIPVFTNRSDTDTFYTKMGDTDPIPILIHIIVYKKYTACYIIIRSLAQKFWDTVTPF